MTAKVSVVMPAFNAERTIGEAVDSVLAQTMSDWELVICDDASSDDTAERVTKYRDPRIRLLRNERNLGEGKSRDRAIYAAQGEWIAVLDADDGWVPTRLERMLEVAEGREDVVVIDDLMVCHHSAGGMIPWRPMRGRRAFSTRGSGSREIRFEDFIRAERLLIKPLFPRRLVEDHGIRHSTKRFAADTEYFLRIGALGPTWLYVPEPMYLYRAMPGSATAVAPGVHLMRECIEECLAIEGMSVSAIAALREKIESLRVNEALYALAGRFRGRDVFGFFGVLLRNPGLIRYAPRRVLRHLAYQWHRIRHSGSGR